MFNYYGIPEVKKVYVQRGTKILNQIQELESQEVQTNETKRQLKHLWKQFYEIFNFVFSEKK